MYKERHTILFYNLGFNEERIIIKIIYDQINDELEEDNAHTSGCHHHFCSSHNL
jgi:hypothetical protein